ncbi:MAG: Coenzyme F420 hydrogenase/dehydrogenase, beta subunit C-terminal domain [Yoonia sp.]
MCTDCGLSRMKLAAECGRACQFTTPNFPSLEAQVHGAARDTANEDALFFGPHIAMHRAAMRTPKTGAQWTGITTSLAANLLEIAAVDAVLTLAPAEDDIFRPVPVIITDPADMARVRGMRMGYAPLLSLLEPAAEAGHKRLAIIGIPCQVHALRNIEAQLGFERLYVIGTPCSDNTTTENFHTFLALLTDKPETVTYLEFRADYRVEVRFENAKTKLIPFLSLPISDLPDDFFPLTCRTCTDYTNALADITVGYMAGEGEQWLIVRNARGQEMLDALGDEIRLAPVKSSGNRAVAVKGFAENTARAAGGLPLRRMPNWIRPIVSFLQPRIGPKGREFAKARLEMKAVETILHLRRAAPARMKHMIPDHVWSLAAPYGLRPEPDEQKTPSKTP